MSDSIELTTYHEAGHVLTALQLGARVRHVTIEPNWDDGPDRYGDTLIEWPHHRLSAEQIQAGLIRVALAGPVAEMIYTGDPFHPGLVAEWADDWRLAWIAAEPFHAQEMPRLRWLEQQSVSLHRWLCSDRQWAAIAAIADELAAHETLDEEMISEITSPWID